MPDIMGAGDLAFPHLHIYLRNVPKSFSVFGFEIAMYAVCVTTGFLLAFALITKLAKDSSQDPDTYWDFFFWLMPVSILGARIYYVIFDWNRLYQGNILQIFNIRDGGLPRIGLTTVEQPKKLLASMAVDSLLDKIENELSGYTHRILTPSLVERTTCRRVD